MRLLLPSNSLEMRGALKHVALEIRKFVVNKLGELCRVVTKGIGERQLELLLLGRLTLLLLGWQADPSSSLLLGWSQLLPHWLLLLLLPDCITHLAGDLAIRGAKIRTAKQLK